MPVEGDEDVAPAAASDPATAETFESAEPAGALRGPERRLAFAKLLHPRLCGGPLENLLNPDVGSLVGPCMQVTYTIEVTMAGKECVSYNDQDACGIGWGGTRAYCTSKAVTGMVSRLRVTCEGSDQGWGNTGHSRIEIALLRESDGGSDHPRKPCWRHYPLGAMTHDRSKFTLDCSAAAAEGEDEDQESSTITMPRSLCTEAQAGDRYALVMVSAPYPGFQCKCFQATIEADVYC